MKKIVCFIIAMAFMLNLKSSAFCENDLYYPKSMLVLGDSISTGYGLEGYDKIEADKNYMTKSYANLLCEKYNIKDNYHNFAIDGQTSSELLAKIKNGDMDNYIKNSEFIIISMGGNDVMNYFCEIVGKSLGNEDNFSIKDIFDVNLKDINVYKNIFDFLVSGEAPKIKENTIHQFSQNISQINNQLKSLNPDAKIIYQTVFNPINDVKKVALLNTLIEDLIVEINNIIINNSVQMENDVETTQYYYVDVYREFYNETAKYTNILNNDIHPNQDGHTMIFHNIDSLISTIYQIEYSMTLSKFVSSAIIEQVQNDDTNENIILLVVIIAIAVIPAIAIIVILNGNNKK